MELQKQVEKYIDAHREEIIADWKALVNLEGRGNQMECMDEIAYFLRDLFTAAGFSCTLERPDGAPFVLVGTLGANRPKKPVLFGGHYDTVFERGVFGANPFCIDEEGKAHGPGCLDMKGGIIISLWVAKALEAVGYQERPIRIVYCGDEEGYLCHSASAVFLRKAAEGVAASFNMETGPINNALCIGRKGAMLASFEVHGVAAHSGNAFEKGRNAVAEAAYKMVALHELTDMEEGTHVNVAVVHGGRITNQVPDSCKVEFSARLASRKGTQRYKDRLAAIMEHTTVEGTSTVYTPGIVFDIFEPTEDNKSLLAFMNRVAEKYGYPPMEGVFLGGGSDAGQFAAAGSPTLCSCGVRGEWNHTEKEYAVAESVFERSKLFAAAVIEMDEFSD